MLKVLDGWELLKRAARVKLLKGIKEDFRASGWDWAAHQWSISGLAVRELSGLSSELEKRVCLLDEAQLKWCWLALHKIMMEGFSEASSALVGVLSADDEVEVFRALRAYERLIIESSEIRELDLSNSYRDTLRSFARSGRRPEHSAISAAAHLFLEWGEEAAEALPSEWLEGWPPKGRIWEILERAGIRASETVRSALIGQQEMFLARSGEARRGL